MGTDTPDAIAASPNTSKPTTVQNWLDRSELQGFNLPGEPITSDPIVTRLPTFEELKQAEESQCGQKFFVIDAARKDTSSGCEHVPCAAVGVLYIKDSPEHYHGQTTELYYVLDDGAEGSHMVIGNEVVPVRKGTIVLLPPGEKNKHGGFGELQALMLFTPGLAKKGNSAERDEQLTGVKSRASAAKLPTRDIAKQGEQTEGGIIVAQIPQNLLGTPGEIADDETQFARSIPNLSVTAMTVRGNDATSIKFRPGATSVVTILGGDGEVKLGEKRVSVAQNSVVLIPSGTPAALLARDGGAMNVLLARMYEDKQIVAANLTRGEGAVRSGVGGVVGTKE